MPGPLIAAPALAGWLGSAVAPVLLDVRWALGDPDGERHYLDGHLPGARFVDLDRELAGPPGAGAGRHPLPDIADLEASARRWGIRDGSAVVVYDDSGGMAAARAWWLLRWAGLVEVRLLDGGLAAWRVSGGTLELGAPPPAAPGDVTLGAGHLPTLDADGAAALARSGVLLDARAGERYRGEVEPVDPRAGHIPGARSAPTAANLDTDCRFLPPAQLRSRFAALGVDDGPVGVYCGSGVTAAHEALALAVIGVDAAVYVGSWSAWASDPDRPAATGPG